jgi:hypothetical protein
MTSGPDPMRAAYAPPVLSLFSFGALDWTSHHPDRWRDYRASGLDDSHGPELARLLADPAVVDDDSDEGMWTVVHAWRAAGQLRGVEAVEPLISLMREQHDDWMSEELPVVLGMIGPPALPMLRRALPRAVWRGQRWGAVGIASSLQEVAAAHPEVRSEVVSVLAGQLELHAEQDVELNGFLVSYLMDLRAVEAAGVMEAAFAAGSVFPGIAGDWEDVQVELGLLPERVTQRALFPLFSGGAGGGRMPGEFAGGGGDAGRARGEARAREKAAKRRKAEKRARKAGKRGRGR